MSIAPTGKPFFHNSQLLLYTKRFWFSLALNWFSLILNLKMLLQVTIRSIIQGKVTSAWGQGKHHSYIPCYCKMCCESIENMLSFPRLKEDHATIWLTSCWTVKQLHGKYYYHSYASHLCHFCYNHKKNQNWNHFKFTLSEKFRVLFRWTD